MKHYSNCACHLFRPGMMVCFALMVGWILAGCSKTQKTVEAAAPAPESSQPQNQMAHPPVYPPAGESAPAPQNIRDMERVLVGWVISHHQRPKNFEEFVTATKIQVPPAPPGKKYMIAKNMHIVLVDK